MDETRTCRDCGEVIELVSLQGPGFQVSPMWASLVRTRDPLTRPFVVMLGQCGGLYEGHHPAPRTSSATTDSPAGGATSAEPSTAEPAENG